MLRAAATTGNLPLDLLRPAPSAGKVRGETERPEGPLSSGAPFSIGMVRRSLVVTKASSPPTEIAIASTRSGSSTPRVRTRRPMPVGVRSSGCGGEMSAVPTPIQSARGALPARATDDRPAAEPTEPRR